MQRICLAIALAVGLAAGHPALACRMYSRVVLDDVQFADVVVVGRVFDYKVIRDEEFRRRRLSEPNLSPDLRKFYEGPETLMSDYARFEIQVDEVLVGKAEKRFAVTWDNSTFGEPETLPAGPYLIALRMPTSAGPPLRGPSATISANPEPGLPTLLQAPCSSPFLFPVTSDEAVETRRILGKASPPIR